MTDAMDELKNGVNKLTQIASMGNTFESLMDSLRTSGDKLANALPWVPFDPDGLIECTLMPTRKIDGYALIYVRCDGVASFPHDQSAGYRITTADSTLTVLSGQVILKMAGISQIVRPVESVVIPRNTMIRLTYEHCTCTFRQSPWIPGKNELEIDRWK